MNMLKKCMTIYYDGESGELSEIKETQDFIKEGALLRVDILQDISLELGLQYETEKDDLYKELFTHIEDYKKELLEEMEGEDYEVSDK
tara:strand:- start:11327 stop:11590 length:264 start_codon:yes stop_codon:yes gene_type:complete